MERTGRDKKSFEVSEEALEKRNIDSGGVVRFAWIKAGAKLVHPHKDRCHGEVWADDEYHI